MLVPIASKALPLFAVYKDLTDVLLYIANPQDAASTNGLTLLYVLLPDLSDFLVLVPEKLIKSGLIY